MAKEDEEDEGSWLSPGKLLGLFCTMELLIYIDRGVTASNGVLGSLGPHPYGVQGDFHLTLPQLGLLPAAFMVGLLIASPIFAEASKHHGGLRLIACGLGIWALAAAGCGLSIGFWTLLISRMVVGVGEASFVALAAPFIDDSAPKATKTLWLAAFYLCIPTGYAIGYLLGGLIAAPLGWRAPFLLEAAIMAPFAALCACLPPLKLVGTHPRGPELASGGALKELWRDIVTLCKHPVYVVMLLGNAVYTGVIGAYAFLGPKAGTDTFHVEGSTSDFVFGGVTVITGALGTLVGGLALDYVGSSIANALILCAVGCLVGCVCIVGAFGAAKSLQVFVAPFAVGELGLFALQAPVNAVALWAVPPQLRPLAISLSVVVIHLLGDVPSPPLLGILQDRAQNWRISMGVCTATLVFAAAFFFAAAWLSKQQPDYRTVSDSRAEADAVEDGSVTAPLVHSHSTETEQAQQ